MAQVIWNSDIDVYDPNVIPILVATGIAKYLPIPDLISFSMVSRNTFKTANNPNLWVSKLKQMGVWDNTKGNKGLENTRGIGKETLRNPLTVLDNICPSPKVAKYQVLCVYRSLNSFYIDLLSNKAYNELKIFQHYQTPEQQARILKNLLKYNQIDYNDSTKDFARDKIISLLEIFENALLRELEIYFDVQDYLECNKFVKILVYLGNDQTLIDFFLQKTLFDNESSRIYVTEFDSEIYFAEVRDPETDEIKFELKREQFSLLISALTDMLNREYEMIDLIFPPEVPIMLKVYEEFFSNQLVQIILALNEKGREKSLYSSIVPFFYKSLTQDFLKNLRFGRNIGPNSHKLVLELINMIYEPYAAEYIQEEIQTCKEISNEKIELWKNRISKREVETTQNILKHVKLDTKKDFLSSFKKVFTINSTSEKEDADKEEKTFTEVQAKAQILFENIRSLDKILSLELVMEIVNLAKLSFNRLLIFREYTIVSLRSEVFAGAQEIFMNLIDVIGGQHITPGFEKALAYLRDYNPKEINITSDSASFIEPLVIYCELINVADMMIQMVDIFYKEELCGKQIVRKENSILNPSSQSKKKFEALVDSFVADGLNAGIDVLMNEIENIYANFLKPSSYNPSEENLIILSSPTEAATRAVNVLESNINLLVGCTDRMIVEVFQQEIAERFFQLLLKRLKKCTVSVTGAVTLISDLNLYYNFIINNIKTNKKAVIPLFQALKNVGSIYLIATNDSKAIGKLVNDLSKFNGIFGQEEIYELVQRRADWMIIRKDVEKVMYGLSLVDCTIV